MQVIDPRTGRPTDSYPEMDADAVEAALARAHDAFGSWRRVAFADRASLLRRVAEQFRARRDALAERMAREMGKPISQGRGEADKCAWVCEHYADHGAAYLAPEPVDIDGVDAHVSYQPQGVLLSIMPWNFPLWQVMRQAAPALMAGNTVALKHAANVPGCAEDLASVFSDAEAPEGLFENLRIDHTLAEEVICDRRVRAVTLTGSVRAGRAVGATAGEALTPSVLELGGSDPYLVLEDADLDRAVDKCVTSRLINSGQSCIAAKRWIVVDAVHDDFVARALDAMRAKTVGDPLDAHTDVGPMAREDLRDGLHDQVTRSAEAGATVALGGEVPARDGWWYPPTLLTGVTPGMPAFDEELFGPAAAVIRADDEADAIALANRSSFGLGAAVFTRNVERGRRIAELELDAGACFVNDFVKSDPRLPFGGVKDSGYGRELARAGILALVNTKTVYVSVT